MIGEICKGPNLNKLKELKDNINCNVYCETGVFMVVVLYYR